MPANNRTKYTGDYQRRARALRNAANADPTTRCWRTGLTLAEGKAKWGPDITWQAGHVDGLVNVLRPELSKPNMQAGAIAGNKRRAEPQAPRWW